MKMMISFHTQRKETSMECCVCLEPTLDCVVYAPCCHAAVCAKCSKLVPSCPICREGSCTTVTTATYATTSAVLRTHEFWEMSSALLQPLVTVFMGMGDGAGDAIQLAVELMKYFILRAGTGTLWTELSMPPLLAYKWRHAKLFLTDKYTAWLRQKLGDVCCLEARPVNEDDVPASMSRTQAVYCVRFPKQCFNDWTAKIWSPMNISLFGIEVQHIHGNDRTLLFITTMHSDVTVSALKAAIQEMNGIPIADQRLDAGTDTLQDVLNLSDYGMKAGATLILTETVEWTIYVDEAYLSRRFAKYITAGQMKTALAAECGIGPRRALSTGVVSGSDFEGNIIKVGDDEVVFCETFGKVLWVTFTRPEPRRGLEAFAITLQMMHTSLVKEVMATLDTTLAELKLLVATQAIGNPTVVDRVRVSVGSRSLHNDDATLGDLNICGSCAMYFYVVRP